MLIEFRVENHRSIRDELILSMEAGKSGAEDDPRPRSVPGCSEKILPVVAIYGANASGKSNVLAAFAFMKDTVVLSHRNWAPEDGILRDPFAWGQRRDEPSLYEVEAVIEDVRYRYGFRANDERFLEEWLYAWPNGKKQTWLERDGDVFMTGENLRGENKVIEEVTRPNALFLSAAAQLKHPQLTPLYSWFSSIQVINVHSGPILLNIHRTEPAVAFLLDESVEVRQRILFDEETSEPMLARFKALLKSADLGIVDARVIKRDPGTAPRSRPWRFELKHQSEAEDAWLPLDEESRGTQTLFRLALPILRAIQRGRILLVDEVEASMHPMLADIIVRQFNDPKINPRNAQLIFTTHDTNLLGSLVAQPALRRDQVWLTEKDPRGATVLYPLTDFKPRKEENLERGYLQGRYGAIPFLANFHFPEE